MSDTEEGTTVAVTSKGQATIPKEFRDKLNIDTLGRVRFVENEEGEIVIRPVKRPSEIRGALATSDNEGGEQTATEMLRKERKRNKTTLGENHERSEIDK